jgi:CBS domain-containing protein
MKTTCQITTTSPYLTLQAAIAEELMVINPVSIHAKSKVADAVKVMTERGFTVAPVINDQGRPIGVISATDILIHDREFARLLATPKLPGFEESEPAMEPSPIIVDDPTTVEEIMTPAIFSVTLDTPAAEVIQRFLDLKVHHLFVIDDQQIIVGVISPGDIMKKLQE